MLKSYQHTQRINLIIHNIRTDKLMNVFHNSKINPDEVIKYFEILLNDINKLREESDILFNEKIALESKYNDIIESISKRNVNTRKS